MEGAHTPLELSNEWPLCKRLECSAGLAWPRILQAPKRPQVKASIETQDLKPINQMGLMDPFDVSKKHTMAYIPCLQCCSKSTNASLQSICAKLQPQRPVFLVRSWPIPQSSGQSPDSKARLWASALKQRKESKTNL